MKEEQRYIDKLLRLPEQFSELYYQKKYAGAKYVYDTAIRVAEFLDISEQLRHQLFGYRTDEDGEIRDVPGMFNAWEVDKCYRECTINLYKSYEHESYRRFGEPPRYYPAPRYPVPGYPKET